jgi:hypothetical protein
MSTSKPSRHRAEPPARTPAAESLDFSRLYRAVVEPADWRGTERIAFVEASSDRDAVRKIAAAIGALEYRLPVTIEERIYNCSSAAECVEEGMSEDPDLRIFETGWNGHGVTYAREPLFLLDAPAVLARKWASIPQEVPTR